MEETLRGEIRLAGAVADHNGRGAIMDHIILVRYGTGKIVAIEDEEENIEVFPDFDAALKLANNHMLCQRVPYQIVELDEL